MSHRHYHILFILMAGVLLFGAFVPREEDLPQGEPLFVTAIAPLGEYLVMTQKRDSAVVIYSEDGRRRLRSWRLPGIPTGVTVNEIVAADISSGEPDGKTDSGMLYVTVSGPKGGVCVVNPDGLEDGVQAFIPTGSGACSPVLNPAADRLYVCNRFEATVSEIDLSLDKVVRTVKVLREPNASVLSPDGKRLFVANFLPAGRADVDTVTSCVSVIDVERFNKIKDIPLANGSNALRGMALSADGLNLFVTHNLGRFQVPTSQLQQGWMNTSAMSVIDIAGLSYGGAVLLDEPDRGAAGIWDVACTPNHLVITHSGTHEISLIDYEAFISRYRAYPDKTALSYDLRFMNDGTLRRRIPLTGNGPRSMTLLQGKVFVTTYFSDTLNIVDPEHVEQIEVVALVGDRRESRVQRGEKYFNDATYCFQNWQSCNGCHPGEARTDGLNWDLLNDGIGNPKNCKSMLFSHATPPGMISGIREGTAVAVRAGYKHIQFNEIPEELASCVDDYLSALTPVPSPCLVDGALSERAERGKEVFRRYDCDYCHSGPYFTDGKMHRIGEDVEFEKGWDTPTLREVWRTAPYLFDGRAATMKEVFATYGHGLKDRKITPEEVDELVEYVNSL